MSDGITLKADTGPLQKLVAVMHDYMALTGKPQSAALQKAAREVDYAMLVQMRVQPPRPVAGSITAAAKARGWRVNTNSDGYFTAYGQALKLLGGYKSGYFRILERNGRTLVDPVLLGASGKVLKTSRGKKSPGYSLVTHAGQASIPPGAKRLNLGALATLLAIQGREKAAAGGYMAQEFQTYKALNRGTVQPATYYTKDHKGVGKVAGEAANGNLNRVRITGYVQHAGDIAEKYGVVSKAFEGGADAYRTDMYAYVVRKNQELLAKLGRS